MATFQFVARGPDGRVERGLEQAVSAGVAVAAIRNRGWTIIDLTPSVPEHDAVAESLAKLAPSEWLPVRSLDVEISLRQLAVMLRGGLTLLAGLSHVSEQSSRASMRRVWRTVAERVQTGSDFANALSAHRCFPELVVQLIRIGEQTGNLDLVLRRGAELMERRRSIKNTLLTAMAYPMLVLVAALGVTAFMIFGVIPKLEIFLKALGRKLPAMTQSLIDVSDFVRTNVVQGAIMVFVFAGVAFAVYSSVAGRLWVDRILLRLPIIGHLCKLAATALVSRALSTLLHSGVTLLEALRAIETLPRNRHLRRRLQLARDNVISGGTLAEGLRERHAFLKMLPTMSAIGESAGTLDEVMEETAQFHDEELRVAIRRFSALIEPAIVVVVGSIVGYVYIAFFVAMFAAAGG